MDWQSVLELEGPVLRFGIRGHVLARAFPEFPAERTAQVNGCLAVHLACEDVADGIEHHVGILLTVVPHQLALVLGSKDHGNLVGTGGVHQVVQTFHEDCRKLVQQDSAVQLAWLVDCLAQPGHVQSEGRAVYLLAVRVVSHADYLRMFRVVDVHREVIPGQYPVQVGGCEP